MTAQAPGDALFDDVGDVLFAAVNVARKLHVDPELALRAASGRFRGRVETAEAPRRGRRRALVRTSASTHSFPTTPKPASHRRTHEPDRSRPRPPDPRQPRQPDRRGRGPAALRRDRTRSGAVRRLDRRVRGDRAARRRRRRSAARASRRPWRTSTARSPRRSAGTTPTTSAAWTSALLRARRDAEQVAPRRQRDPRRLAGGGARRGRGGGAAAVALPRRRRTRTSCRCR